jgi:hypothetical protein
MKLTQITADSGKALCCSTSIPGTCVKSLHPCVLSYSSKSEKLPFEYFPSVHELCKDLIYKNSSSYSFPPEAIEVHGMGACWP